MERNLVQFCPLHRVLQLLVAMRMHRTELEDMGLPGFHKLITKASDGLVLLRIGYSQRSAGFLVFLVNSQELQCRF